MATYGHGCAGHTGSADAATDDDDDNDNDNNDDDYNDDDSNNDDNGGGSGGGGGGDDVGVEGGRSGQGSRARMKLSWSKR